MIAETCIVASITATSVILSCITLVIFRILASLHSCLMCLVRICTLHLVNNSLPFNWRKSTFCVPYYSCLSTFIAIPILPQARGSKITTIIIILIRIARFELATSRFQAERPAKLAYILLIKSTYNIKDRIRTYKSGFGVQQFAS